MCIDVKKNGKLNSPDPQYVKTNLLNIVNETESANHVSKCANA